MRTTLQAAGMAAVAALFASSPLTAQDAGDERTAAPSDRTIAEGVYSEEQAARGEEVMWSLCAECHVDGDFGTAFLRSWEGATIAALLDELKATMPEDNPGGLRDQEYLDVIGYILSINGLPTGEAEIGAADAERITIEWEP
ncbi:MAG: cytochrome c [Gemmatimonadota bacterium]|nr:cytochrome c [Gemmatimonadota bacterium]